MPDLMVTQFETMRYLQWNRAEIYSFTLYFKLPETLFEIVLFNPLKRFL
jgi:hypothetical protein